MSELISDTAIEKATGATWNTWVERLERMGARDLPHEEIAAKLVAEHQVAGWWSQALTVRYEKLIGRRQLGQNNNGHFSTSVTKTLPGTLTDGFHWWLSKVQAQAQFNGVAIISSSATETEKWRYYRAALQDGSRVIVGIYAKSPNKAGLGLQHEKLPTSESAQSWRAYWKLFLTDN